MARAVEWSCGRIKATAVCSARSEQCHARRSNSTIHVVVDRTSIMTVQAGCDLVCATSLGAQLNQRCACEVVDDFSLHESLRSAFTEFTADPSVHAHQFSPSALFVHSVA